MSGTFAGGGAGITGAPAEEARGDGAAVAVLRCADTRPDALVRVAARFGIRLVEVAAGESIPGTYWGEPEAGLIGNCLFLRGDTPLHSVLHELCHYVCMSADRRGALHTDAGGTTAEECAVCYLQLRLAEHIDGFGLGRALADMDAWGYSFREGSAAAWYRGDGADARAWLQRHGLLDADGEVTWRLRACAGPGRPRQSLVGFGASP